MKPTRQPVTAIVDIGKTNKKFFVFDENFDEITHEYIRFDEVPDDDGFLSENIDAVVEWMKSAVTKLLHSDKHDLKYLNFSTYGASMVHLDNQTKQVVPFYNYLKPFDSEVFEAFMKHHKLEHKAFSSATSSPLMGFLNSGLQLPYLKYKKQELFKMVSHSLHFPQYLSSIFTQKFFSEYTSLGCHTALWDFTKNNYHQWVIDEGFDRLLAEILPSHHSVGVQLGGKNIQVGIGLHDSSSALVPYIQASTEPFVLISTGTWSICMNYFNHEPLTVDHLEKDCLNFLSTAGTNIKASRLFLGKHMSNQARLLADYFSTDYSTYKTMPYNAAFSSKRKNSKQLLFDHSVLNPERFGFSNNPKPTLEIFDSYEGAYYHLMDELTDLQIASLKLAIGQSRIKTIYVDGGFSSNEVFMQMLANKLPQYKIYASSFAKGTALGAALMVTKSKLPKNYLHKHYNLKLHKPVAENTVV